MKRKFFVRDWDFFISISGGELWLVSKVVLNAEGTLIPLLEVLKVLVVLVFVVVLWLSVLWLVLLTVLLLLELLNEVSLVQRLDTLVRIPADEFELLKRKKKDLRRCVL